MLTRVKKAGAASCAPFCYYYRLVVASTCVFCSTVHVKKRDRFTQPPRNSSAKTLLVRFFSRILTVDRNWALRVSCTVRLRLSNSDVHCCHRCRCRRRRPGAVQSYVYMLCEWVSVCMDKSAWLHLVHSQAGCVLVVYPRRQSKRERERERGKRVTKHDSVRVFRSCL